MSNSDEPKSATLTANDVRQWKEERNRLEARIAQITRKIEAAELLFPGIGSADVTRTPARKVASGGSSMGEAVKIAIRGAGVPLAPPDIRQRLQNSVFAEQLSNNPNYLYTVIFRLAKRGELIREGDRYRLPPEENAGEAAGEDDLPRALRLQA